MPIPKAVLHSQMSDRQGRNIELFAKQFDFVTCADKFCLFVGGIGSGKSFAGAAKLLSFACTMRGLGMVIAPTYTMLRDSTIRVLRDVAGTAWAAEDFNKSEMLARIGDSEIIFRSADKPERLRGSNLSFAWIDEAALCPATTWDILIGRLRQGSKSAPMWLTTTPKGRNWIYVRKEQMTVFNARTSDNPYLNRDFVTSLEANYTGEFARQELEGEFVSWEGLIYAEFDHERHVQADRRGPWSRVIIGADLGYTNPAAAVVIGLDSDNRAHVLTEFYERRLLQTDFAARLASLRAEYGAEAVYVDPSAASLIAELEGLGVYTVPANNNVMDGIQHVKTRLSTAGDGRTRLTFDPSCANLLSELEQYAWAEKSNGKEMPQKVNDHALDALRYALMSTAQDYSTGRSVVIKPIDPLDEERTWETWHDDYEYIY